MKQRGSILIYILIAIFLTGVLIASMSQGAKKSASSEQIDEVMMYLQNDLRTIQANITECVVSYQNNNFCPPNAAGTGVSCVSQYATQDSGNPNPPFPMPSASAGTALLSTICPRAPSQPIIFNDNIIQSLKLLQDTSNYTTTYFNENNITVPGSGIEGVYLRITRTISDPIWAEALSRLNTKYSACQVAVVTAGNADPTGYTCTNGCLYYWILRLPSSSTQWKTGCP